MATEEIATRTSGFFYLFVPEAASPVPGVVRGSWLAKFFPGLVCLPSVSLAQRELAV